MAGPLKLSANDAGDIEIVSALLQDAIFPFGDMIFEPTANRFVFVATRFRWEDVDGPPVEGRIYERVHTGVRFDGVKSTRLMHIDQSRKAQVMSLLAVECGEGEITLVFAGGAAIRLEVDRILCHMEDVDEPWPTQWLPTHPDD